ARVVGQHVLAETRREFGEALYDRGVASLRCGRKPRTLAYEVQMDPLDKPRLLRGKTKILPLLLDGLDAREELRVEINRAVMGGQARRHLPLDRPQRRRRLRCRQIEE